MRSDGSHRSIETSATSIEPDRQSNPAATIAPGTAPELARRFVREAFIHHLRRSPNLPASIASSVAADIETLPLGLPCDDSSRSAPQAQRDLLSADWPAGNDALAGRDHEAADLRALFERIAMLAESLRERLATWHKLPEKLVHEVVTHGREGAIAMVLASPHAQASSNVVVAILQDLQLLTPTVILRALCLGQLSFATAGFALRAGVPALEIEERLRDQGADGLSSYYGTAQVPAELCRAFRAALHVLLRENGSSSAGGRAAVTGEIIAQLVNAYAQVCPEDLEHVLCQLTRHSLERPNYPGPLRPALA